MGSSLARRNASARLEGRRALTAAASSGASAVTAGETPARSSSLLAGAARPRRAATRCRGCRLLPHGPAGAAAGVVAAPSAAMGGRERRCSPGDVAAWASRDDGGGEAESEQQRASDGGSSWAAWLTGRRGRRASTTRHCLWW